jgi:hypothetical protein
MAVAPDELETPLDVEAGFRRVENLALSTTRPAWNMSALSFLRSWRPIARPHVVDEKSTDGPNKPWFDRAR